MIDLHTHSTASDGKHTPQELIDMAIKKNIYAIALTDHDSIAGLKQGIKYAKEKNFEFIPGIEISYNDPESQDKETHIVGLYVNPNNSDLISFCNWMKKEREIQKKKIIEKLNELGYEISYNELIKEAKGAVFGRPHIANILLRKYPEKFESFQYVFDEFLAQGKKAYVPQEKPNLQEVIKIIKNAEGISILAHPGLYSQDIITNFIKAKGDGIEVNYPYSNKIKDYSEKELIETYFKIAKENNLIISGGTDFHYKTQEVDLGDYGLTNSEFELLKNNRVKL